MKISSEQIMQSMALPHRPAGDAAAEKAKTADFTDVLAKAKAALDAMPDVRAEHIAEALKRVDADGPGVPDDEIAEKLLGRSLTDRLA